MILWFKLLPIIFQKLVTDITEVFAKNKDKVQDITEFFKSLMGYLNIKSQKNPDVTISKFLIIVEDLLTIFYQDVKVTEMETGEPVLINAENCREELLKYYHGWV